MRGRKAILRKSPCVALIFKKENFGEKWRPGIIRYWVLRKVQRQQRSYWISERKIENRARGKGKGGGGREVTTTSFPGGERSRKMTWRKFDFYFWKQETFFSAQNENTLPPPIPAMAIHLMAKNLFRPHAGDLRRERGRTAALDHHQRPASPTSQYLTGDGGGGFRRQRSSQPALRINSRYFFFCLNFFSRLLSSIVAK